MATFNKIGHVRVLSDAWRPRSCEEFDIALVDRIGCRTSVTRLICCLTAFGFCATSTADNFELAEKMFFSGEYQKCLEEADIAIGGGDDGERWYLLRIDCLMTTGEYLKARHELEEGLAANPNSIQLRLAGYEVWKHNDRIQRARELLMEMDELIQYRRWRYRDVWNQVAQGRHRLLQRADAKEVLEDFLTPASLKDPDQSVAFLAIGDLGLAKHDYALAEENFQKAVELQPDNPAGFLGLAKAWRPSDLEKSSDGIVKAMQLNRDYVPGLHYLVNDRLDSESYSEANELIDRILKINPRDVKAWAFRAVVAHIQNDPDMEAKARKNAFAVWKGNPEIDYLIGKKLSQRYRFAEGAKMQRRSLTYDARFLPAKIQLASDLLRLGNDQEGWRLADEVYQQDGYNVVAYNLVTLGNKVAGYTALDRDGFIVRMEPFEADIYGDQVLDLLVEAKKTLCEKYDVKVAEPIFVEIFPQQQDFAIRTFGLPGGSGFLGVCFGRVITMNSPKSQVRTGSNWQAVLWHEFCHVVTLQKTGNKMPRWLSEGISVYEESQKDSSWGQVMTPEWRDWILTGKLTPVSQLSSAFVNPESGQALQFAYYESSLVVRFLIEEYGLDTLKRILDDLKIGIPINEVLGRYAGGMPLLDEEFAVYAHDQASELAVEANWEKPDLTSQATLQQWQAWNASHPNNIYGLKSEAALLIKDGKEDRAEPLVKQFLNLYPEYRGPDNGYALLSMIARSAGDEQAEFEMLKKSSALQSAATEVYERLAGLAAGRSDWQESSKQARRWLSVNPLIPAPHRAFAEASENQGDFENAISSLKALTRMDPFDPAETYYRYAVALNEIGKTELAKREVLKCLEEAPRYRKAHQLLLHLVESVEGKHLENGDEPDTGSDEYK